VRVGSTPEEFSDAIAHALNKGMSMKWRERADSFIGALSWEKTWSAMNNLIEEVIEGRKARVPSRLPIGAAANLGEAARV
jgi:hypothetical protein